MDLFEYTLDTDAMLEAIAALRAVAASRATLSKV